MSSRRDQVDAQRYMLARVTGALVRAEPETAESPTRRDRTGTITGLVLAVLLLGGVAIWALIPGAGSTRWQQPRTLLVDATSGARYVLIGGELRQVFDLATATLAAGGRLTPMVVSTSKLAKMPQGDPVGTPAGPQVLPVAGMMGRGVWRACDLSARGVGLDIAVPADERPLGADEAVRVSGDGKTYLLWGGRRLLLGEAWVADVLGLGLLPTVPVAPAWLDLLPVSGTAGPPVVGGTGGAGPVVAGRPTSIGQMFAVDLGNGKTGHYLMTTDGLAPLTETEYLLQRARPGTAPETPIRAADLAAARQRTTGTPLTTLPATPPRPRSTPAGAAVCVEFSGRPGRAPAVAFSADHASPPPADSIRKTAVVRVPAGGGALLLPQLDGDPQRMPAVLVDERGIAYPIAGRDISTLGYAAGQAAVMPPELLALLPVGPALARPGEG